MLPPRATTVRHAPLIAILSPIAASFARVSAERVREAPGYFLRRDTTVPNSTMSPVNTLFLHVNREVQCPLIEP